MHWDSPFPHPPCPQKIEERWMVSTQRNWMRCIDHIRCCSQLHHHHSAKTSINAIWKTSSSYTDAKSLPFGQSCKQNISCMQFVLIEISQKHKVINNMKWPKPVELCGNLQMNLECCSHHVCLLLMSHFLFLISKRSWGAMCLAWLVPEQWTNGTTIIKYEVDASSQTVRRSVQRGTNLILCNLTSTEAKLECVFPVPKL